MAHQPGHKNEKVGEVVSAKMTKTIVVEVTRRVAHPVYKRIVQKRKKFYAHDEQSSANVGDFVRIIECRALRRAWGNGTATGKRSIWDGAAALFPVVEVQEAVAQGRVGLEDAGERGGDRGHVAVVDAAGGHALVHRVHYHSHPARLDHLGDVLVPTQFIARELE